MSETLKCPGCGGLIHATLNGNIKRCESCDMCQANIVDEWQSRAEKAEAHNAELVKELAKYNNPAGKSFADLFNKNIELEAELSKAKARIEELEKKIMLTIERAEKRIGFDINTGKCCAELCHAVPAYEKHNKEVLQILKPNGLEGSDL